VSKLIFLPMRLSAALLSGILGKKLFERLWAVIDAEEPPQPEQRRIDVRKLVLALAIEGGLFRVLKGLADHSSRSAFARLTGRWPGEEAPKRD
jgi:hypothetical protein